mmetsp:Transcript_113726/g.328403  ORF Transcript_113726/g.328403 Transcript_113726/m.328403 type:complete len:213 (-) Transcript_113726:388-1026(-)
MQLHGSQARTLGRHRRRPRPCGLRRGQVQALDARELASVVVVAAESEQLDTKRHRSEVLPRCSHRGVLDPDTPPQVQALNRSDDGSPIVAAQRVDGVPTSNGAMAATRPSQWRHNRPLAFARVEPLDRGQLFRLGVHASDGIYRAPQRRRRKVRPRRRHRGAVRPRRRPHVEDLDGCRWRGPKVEAAHGVDATVHDSDRVAPTLRAHRVDVV